MPIRRTHNKYCISEGVEKSLCDKVNKEMDRPSTIFPGCPHREFNHQKRDCFKIAQKFPKRVRQDVIKACFLHIKLDKKNSFCQRK